MTDPHPATAPIPAARRRGFRDVAATFAIRNYRFVFASMLTGSLGTWFSRVALDWLILELTGNVALVGLALAVQYAPGLAVGLWAGVIADRFPRRRIILLAQTVITLSLAVVAVLALLGIVQVWHVFLAGAVIGVVSIVDIPARTALVTQIVSGDRIQTAISLNALTFHGAGLIGPALSGIVIAGFGSGWALVVATVLTAASGTLILAVRARELAPVPPIARGSGVVEGLRYAARKPAIRWSLVLLAFVASFGMTHTVLYTAAASDVGYGTGAAGYGLYVAIGAVGAVIGAVLSTRRRTVALRSITMLAGTFGVAMLVAAAAPAEWFFLGSIVVFSAIRILFGTGADSLVQLSSRPSIRGRMAALYFVILTGGQVGGAVLIGWIAESSGVWAAFAVAGVIPLIAALVVGIIVAHQHRLRLSVSMRRGSRGVRIEPRHVIGE